MTSHLEVLLSRQKQCTAAQNATYLYIHSLFITIRNIQFLLQSNELMKEFQNIHHVAAITGFQSYHLSKIVQFKKNLILLKWRKYIDTITKMFFGLVQNYTMVNGKQMCMVISHIISNTTIPNTQTYCPVSKNMSNNELCRLYGLRYLF